LSISKIEFLYCAFICDDLMYAFGCSAVLSTVCPVRQHLKPSEMAKAKAKAAAAEPAAAAPAPEPEAEPGELFSQVS
jgi:hypothetical protein